MNEQFRDSRIERLICLVLGILTVAIYLPTLRHDFLSYDDQEYVTQNWQVLRGLTWKGIVWAFGFHAANWHPLTWISHMLDCQVFGTRAWGHHLTNVVLHAANSVLLFLGLRELASSQSTVVSNASRSPQIWQCAFVAALFAWHPLHVESVAWVAERKDVLSALFFMLTLWAYAKHASGLTSQASTLKSPRESKSVQYSVFSIQTKAAWYGLALFFFALALMSKPMVVTLPFVLLLLDFWPLRRVTGDEGRVTRSWVVWRALVLEKVPFFALSAVSCVLTIRAQQSGYAVVSRAGLPLSERIAHAVISYVHYVTASFLPRHLAVFYPYEYLGAGEVAVCALILIAMTVVTIWFARRLPYLLVGWFWFIGMLVPVVGLVQVGEQAWADRYTYLPSIGIFIVIVWVGSEIAAREKPQTPNSKLKGSSNIQASNPPGLRPIGLLGGMAVLALMAGTAVQLRYWRNTRTLFEHAERVTRNNYMAIALVGSLNAAEGDLSGATERYRRALEIKPGYAEAHYLLGDALEKQGKTDESITEFRQALKFKPMQVQTHVSLGLALAKQGNFDEAAEHYRAALNINPESPVAQNNLARVLHSQGRLDDAIEHYRAALKFDPNLAEAHNNLGALLLQQGNYREGIAELRDALRLNGGNPQTALNLALALSETGQWSESAELFERTVGKVSWDARAHYRFGVSLEHNKQPKEAMREYASALLLRQDFPDALGALAWILATTPDANLRNGTEAVRMAQRACELTSGKDARKLQALAAAYAETGFFDKALAALDSASAEATKGENAGLVQECQRMKEAFSSARAWRTAF